MMCLWDMRLTPWSERSLPFGKGTEELPVLVERALGAPARAVFLTRYEPAERLSLRIAGSWSVKEHIAHLLYLDECMDGRVEDFMARRNMLCSIDLTDQERVLAIQHDRPLGDLLEEFRLRRVYLMERVLSMDPGAMRHRAQHPCRGMAMSVVDMVMYLAEHDDHHLALMRGILQLHRGLPSWYSTNT